MPSVAAARRHDLTDVQWAVLEPLPPTGTDHAQPRRWAMRLIIDGIRWRVRTGWPWRDVPAVYPPWQTLYRWFRRWQRAGVWAQILASLQTRADAAGLIGWTVSVDSTISRAHQHAAGARRDGESQKEPPGGVQAEPADHGLGRSRGGWTTKTHLACEQGRKLMALVVTAGQHGVSRSTGSPATSTGRDGVHRVLRAVPGAARRGPGTRKPAGAKRPDRTRALTDSHGLRLVIGHRIHALSCTNVVMPWSALVTDSRHPEGGSG